jgi:hypothetical protein
VCAALGAMLVACLYTVPDVVSDDVTGVDGGGLPEASVEDGELPDGAPPALAAGTLVARTHVCTGAVGWIAASAGQVMVACADGTTWNPTNSTAPAGSLDLVFDDGGVALASTRYPNVAATHLLAATGPSFLVAGNIPRNGALADLETSGGMRTFGCYDGVPAAVTTADGFLYIAGTGGDTIAFGDGVFRATLSNICTLVGGLCSKDFNCSVARLGRLPDAHVSGGVAVLGAALFTYVCAEPTARVYAFPRDGTAATLPPPQPVYDSTNDPDLASPDAADLDAADPDAAPPPTTCSDGAPPGLATLGQSVFFGVGGRMKACPASGACSTVWTEPGPVRVVTTDGALLYWAVGADVRHARPNSAAPSTYFQAPDPVTAIAAGNGQPNVYLGTQAGDVLTVR